MEQYELLQDLPFADKGSIWTRKVDDLEDILTSEDETSQIINVEDIKSSNFDKWFKKVKWQPKINEDFYYIGTNLENKLSVVSYFSPNPKHLEIFIEQNNCFQTREEAEEKLNKIKEILNS